MVDGIEVRDKAVNLPFNVRPVEEPEGAGADQFLQLIVDGLLVPGLRHHDQALVAPLEEVVLGHVVERDDAQTGRPADDPHHGKGIGQAVELVQVVADLPSHPDLARSGDLFGERDLTGVCLWHAAGDHPVAIQREELAHALLVEAIEVELGVARQ